MKVRYQPSPGEEMRHFDLTPGNVYRVIGIEADDYRLMNDEGLPYLYSAGEFLVVDPSEPAEWHTQYGDEGERYSYPPELGKPGFFEDYFDGKSECVAALRRYLAEHRREAS
jgi:hypothetical protein